MHDWKRHYRLQKEFTDRSYLQWILIRSIAFAERDWMLITCWLFWIDKSREFLNVSGVFFFLIGLFMVGPVGGVFMYLTNKHIYKHLKAKGWSENSMGEFKKLSWIANFVWLIVMALIGKFYFDLYYQVYNSLIFF